MSEPSVRSILCHLGTKTAREVDTNLPGSAEQGRTKIPLHKPKVEQGSMGIVVYPFQGEQSSSKDTTGRVILQESLASFGSAHYRMDKTPC